MFPISNYRRHPTTRTMDLRKKKTSNIPMQVVKGNRVLSSVEEVLTKWRNDFAWLLVEPPPSEPAEQVEKSPRSEKHDSTIPANLLDHCWETTASLEEVKFAILAWKNKKAPGPDKLPAEALKNDAVFKNCCIPQSLHGERGQ